jgi:plasmid stabilization system protein ParE
MTRRIELSTAAERQLEECFLYASAAWDERAAEQYIAGLVATFRLLAAMPRAGRHIGAFRRFRYERHLVYYRATKSALFVLRVIHERRAPASHL